MLTRLANKVNRWSNETKADGKEFDHIFTGRDFRMCLHNYVYLVRSFKSHADLLQCKLSDFMYLHLLAWTSEMQCRYSAK